MSPQLRPFFFLSDTGKQRSKRNWEQSDCNKITNTKNRLHKNALEGFSVHIPSVLVCRWPRRPCGQTEQRISSWDWDQFIAPPIIRVELNIGLKHHTEWKHLQLILLMWYIVGEAIPWTLVNTLHFAVSTSHTIAVTRISKAHTLILELSRMLLKIERKQK